MHSTTHDSRRFDRSIGFESRARAAAPPTTATTPAPTVGWIQQQHPAKRRTFCLCPPARSDRRASIRPAGRRTHTCIILTNTEQRKSTAQHGTPHHTTAAWRGRSSLSDASFNDLGDVSLTTLSFPPHAPPSHRTALFASCHLLRRVRGFDSIRSDSCFCGGVAVRYATLRFQL